MRAQHSIIDLIIFYRSALGIPYDAASEGLTRATLETCAQQWGQFDPETQAGEFTSAGVDVGVQLHTQISRVANGKRWIVYHGAPRDFSDLKRVLDLYKVDIVCIDSMPETREVKRFRDAEPGGRVYMTNFGLKCDGSARDETDWLQFDHMAAWIKCDRTMTIDEATDALVRGRAAFPQRFLSNPDWVEQMCAPRRMIVPKPDGKDRAIWDEGSKPDHFRMADVYDMLASKAMMNRLHGRTAPEVTVRDDLHANPVNPIAALELNEAETEFEDTYEGEDRALFLKLARMKGYVDGEHS
jgi:hypothetical protein